MKADVRATLERHGLHLSRELGQNFLIEPGIAERLALLAGVEEGDSIVEVGTGLGVLTRALAERAGARGRIVTLEIDSGLVRALREDALLPAGVELLHADALQVDLAGLIASLPRPVRLVANLPYSAATPLLRRLLDLRGELEDWSVMVQRELAARISARCGSRDYGSFAVLHQLTVDLNEQMALGEKVFFPAPRVRSSFVRIWPRATALLAEGELAGVERVIRACFAKRRKTIANCLRAGGFAADGGRATIERALARAGIDPGARAEVVPPPQLLALARALCEEGAHAAG